MNTLSTPGTANPSPAAEVPASLTTERYHWHRWRDGRWLCDDGTGQLVLVGPGHCSCAEDHFSEGMPCEHRQALAHKLTSEAEALLLEAQAILPEEPKPERCPRCSTKLYHYDKAVRCISERGSYWRILR